MTTTRYVLAVLTASSLALAACEREASRDAEPNPASANPPAPSPAATETIVAVAQRDPEFTTFVSAIQTADMTGTLNGPGPFTIFAPTNAAFEKVPAARRDALTRPEGQAELQALLGSHVVPARLDSASLVQRIQASDGELSLTTLQGGQLTARVDANGSVLLTDAAGGELRVVEADIAGSNGVVHAVDTVAAPG